MKDNGEMDKSMVLEYIITMIIVNMKVNGKMVKNSKKV